ncbi:hydroxyacid dehydrogenase [Stackebrandtia nassauensis]|uniref:D-isomer specific 2-hydroxyacid dehydrogenase NAD-binding protein n=1 Tax=Stackebrandtia nassauensis (strain DSM 44728 / CIP 108903 / NRRL B-16338 / NBRC 102104 / LLR-40K-21) TaxID=446470 RepID=D3PY53_STANL|nr:hydroxyacid dehydrogenase [Stackebrandtia nassauensis]ADD45382.1 D-isomer specific 2-hydroxyacid dehydrogenase NAD-binding protein [Stackebrandtia nassauensis DSM 44728]
MSAKPLGVFAMSRFARETALTPAVLARLLSFADADPGLLVADFAAPEARHALARADFLVTGWGCPTVDDAALELMPRLRLIAHAAGSIKHHVTAHVWSRDITVTSAASANAEPVAEYTRATILLATKRAFTRAANYAADGVPETHPRDCGYVGRTIGIVGASRIGRRVIELLRGYDLRILVSDPYRGADKLAALGAELVPLDELCQRSDVVSVHAPELAETHHLIDDRRLSLMRDGTVLINTARGSLVDTEALVGHCRDGRVDAILDVTDPEPLPAGHPLLLLPNVWVTPHLAGAEGSEIALLGEYAVAETKRFFDGEALLGEVTQADLPRLA